MRKEDWKATPTHLRNNEMPIGVDSKLDRDEYRYL